MAVYGWWSCDTEAQPNNLARVNPPVFITARPTFIAGNMDQRQLLAETHQRLAYLDSFTTWRPS